ncbi:asparagine synthase-domain-containing protein [Endogone sp. FLAS-F59071]|nr:asparagine synthase-domain-containing protein [Endogone sp. FLAS-F59071]|eukprot:RUS18740.1 asparagine synthase-domain-containing protein [Endogone sp. FLAS-F59071]
MCGILFSLSTSSSTESIPSESWRKLQELNARRGPDAQGEYRLALPSDSASSPSSSHNPAIHLYFFGAVLHLRGAEVMPQPVVDAAGNVLCWNGEIFDGIEVVDIFYLCNSSTRPPSFIYFILFYLFIYFILFYFILFYFILFYFILFLPLLQAQVPFGENDTQILMRELEATEDSDDSKTSYKILDILEKIEGPYAIVFWQSSAQKLWFARDCLGRRSLLWHHPRRRGDSFTLTSVGTPIAARNDDDLGNTTAAGTAQPPFFRELPADGVYCLDVRRMLRELNEGLDEVCEDGKVASQPLFHGALSPSLVPSNNSITSIQATLERQLTTKSVIPAVDDLTPVPALASEGAASVPPVSPRMRYAIEGLIDVLSDSRYRLASSFDSVIDHLFRSPVRSPSSAEARIAILFSGGLDCITLAALADRHLPTGEAIDLLNVAFENPRVERAAAVAVIVKKKKKKNKNKDVGGDEPLDVMEEGTKSKYDVPDRLTGRLGVEELRQISPQRTWNFVEVDVPYEEVCAYRKDIIERMAPLDTVMDLSIAMAFWFASRGKGSVDRCHWIFRARVLFSGLGADEQLGGYSRHREAFRQSGWERLIEELQLDVDRISTRNLVKCILGPLTVPGRDDRIISDHSKECRYPYLCTSVVDYLCALPAHLKVDLRYPRGIGEKVLLRHVARALGLQRASGNWKRAVQFGAKTARMTSGGEKGQDGLRTEDRRGGDDAE